MGVFVGQADAAQIERRANRRSSKHDSRLRRRMKKEKEIETEAQEKWKSWEGKNSAKEINACRYSFKCMYNVSSFNKQTTLPKACVPGASASF